MSMLFLPVRTSTSTTSTISATSATSTTSIATATFTPSTIILTTGMCKLYPFLYSGYKVYMKLIDASGEAQYLLTLETGAVFGDVGVYITLMAGALLLNCPIFNFD